LFVKTKITRSVVISALTIGLASVVGACASESTTPAAPPAVVETVDETTEPTAPVEPEATTEPELSATEFESFNQFVTIQIGTSMEDAISALGQPDSTTTTEALGSEMTTLTWHTTNLFRLSTTVVATFTDGYATSILGTADSSSAITLADFNQVTNGMSEQEVYEILGQPYSVTEVELMGSTSTLVMWINADLSSGSVTFTNGQVSMISQSNLN
jgi:hypothetical protein